MLIKWLQYFYKIQFADTAKIDAHERNEMVKAISKRYSHADRQVVLACFTRYPYVVTCHRNGSFCGLFFYNFFTRMNKGYFYFGPLFFFSRSAFAAGTLATMQKYLKRFSRVYFLAEVQNPELVVHLHVVFRHYIQPKPFSYAIDEAAKTCLRNFLENTPQLDVISVEDFRSQGDSTLFYDSDNTELVTKWLRMQGIDLADKQALVVLLELSWWRLLVAQMIICFCLITYPKHRISYLTQLQKFLETSLCNK